MDKFKLLGVWLDSKLTFEHHVTQLRLQINKKLYCIKNLFYLSFSVKVQFFKTFILPFFDYCLSLVIYFPKAIIQRLSNCYYLCLFKLFKFKFSSDDPEKVNEFLKNYNLFGFHQRIFCRLGLFSFRIFTYKSPSILASKLISNLERNIPYNLRNKNDFCVPETQRKFGELTFGHFFSKFINNFFINKFNSQLNIYTFKNYMYSNLINFTKIFVSNFEKFNFFTKFFYF